MIEKYDRKPFSVLAVQVTFENVNQVAEWCKGAVIKQKTKMLGVETEVPAIRVEGQGDNRGKSFVATLGCYVVELKGSFRVYKPQQFDSSFTKSEVLVNDACAVCTNEAEHRLHVEYMIASADKTYKTDISLLDLQENVTPATKAEWAQGTEWDKDDNSTTDGQETAQTA
jgi:hypothetical protein